jgi:hypothetical protein
MVEKLPANNFRLAFLDACFPDARYVHVVRHGVEVARSIERECARGWYGAGDYKWHEIVRLAQANGASLGELATTAADGYERGLLEWRLSVDAATRFAGTIPATRWLEVRYEALVAEPVATVRRILAFLELPPDRHVLEFARADISRRSPAAAAPDEFARTALLAGASLARLGYGHAGMPAAPT